MSLPLLRRSAEPRAPFVFVSPRGRRPTSDPGLASGTASRGGAPAARSRMPDRAPQPGEQYRFHFDMGLCIGCKCCVVACNEQNGNPADINWRRVAEIEGGWYPQASRHYVSMGCNHCVDPTCLKGCPVDAYSKDPVTGIVRHSADTCIGCQYCTWNCSYGVPQFNPERGVVGKCDMCHGRLSLGQSPACVSACPEGAIAIEIVRIDAWAARTAAAVPESGLPSDDGSVSTTHIALPERLPPDARPPALWHVQPAEAHWPLVIMTVLTQLSVGAFAAIWLQQLSGAVADLGIAAIASFAVAALALGASTLHLGRPIHAYRALKMWRRSWLSREVLLFGAFAGIANAYAIAVWLRRPEGIVLGGLTAIVGLAGIGASACIYRVPSRPAWNSYLTPLRFAMTAAVLGPLFASAVVAGEAPWLRGAAVAMAGGQTVLIAWSYLRLSASDRIELRGTARLLSTALSGRFLLRGVLLALGGVVLPLLQGGPAIAAAALVLAFAGELLDRYLFFVSVVPKHMTTPYLPMGSAAA
jgi:Fe-S-cluster-containing dehydrogenase component/DMSO reductase anchor subunit